MTTWRAALLLLALLACKRDQPVLPAPLVPPAPATAQPAPAPLSEAQVKTLLDEWLAAQNAGAFDRYEKLYATKFQGVRRSGPRTVKLDRAGWMADRKRMFAKPMTVALAEVEVVRGTAMARAQFQQTWASGNYKDVGRKQLVIVREGDILRIAREELLDSRIVGHHRDLSQALLLAEDHGVILTTRPEEAWAKGEVQPGKGEFTAMRPVDVAALPAEMAAWQKRKVRLMGKASPLCEGEIAGFSLVGRVTPHFGTVQTWGGFNGLEKPLPKWSAARIAADLWAESAGDGRVLVGELAQECPGALWAFDADKTAPVAATADPIPAGPLLEAAVRAYRRLPLHAQIQNEFGAQGAPWSADTEARTGAWRFAHPTATLVMVSAQRGGCADPYGDLTAIFRLTGPDSAPRLALLSAMSYGERAAPLSAFDLDGDGTLEILFGPEGLRKERGLYQVAGDAYDRFVLAQQPFHDCGC